MRGFWESRILTYYEVPQSSSVRTFGTKGRTNLQQDLKHQGHLTSLTPVHQMPGEVSNHVADIPPNILSARGWDSFRAMRLCSREEVDHWGILFMTDNTFRENSKRFQKLELCGVWIRLEALQRPKGWELWDEDWEAWLWRSHWHKSGYGDWWNFFLMIS